ncbi:MAG: hypothetical protein GX938_05320, partial [Spirochaetales bacterium]|nr:hypothetical protein [Spirochaetales bacterium]
MTSVQVRHLVLAEVDLGGRRDLAIASAAVGPTIKGPRPWVEGLDETSFSLATGWQADLPNRVGQQATTRIVDALMHTGHFSIVGPQGTDVQMQLICAGADGCSALVGRGVTALMITNIPYIDATEHVVGRDVLGQMAKTFTIKDEDGDEITLVTTSNEVVAREYYLVQRVTMTLTYTIHDTTDGQILVSRTFTDAAEAETLIGRRLYSESNENSSAPAAGSLVGRRVSGGDNMGYRDERIYLMRSAPSLLTLFDGLIGEMTAKIATQLAPTWRSSTVALMDIKPKSQESKAAEHAASKGEYRRAFDFYSLLWQREHLLGAGYNAAILLEAMGDLDQALSLMDEVYRFSSSVQAYTALLRIQEAKSQHEKAERQISGEIVDDGQSVMMTQYMIAE